MIKTILKEGIITILLCVAILLILSVIFYDYNPLTKTVPNKVAYVAPNEIKEELEGEISRLNTTNIVYTIEGADLNVYKQSNSYVSGKANPFASSTTSNSNTTDNTELNNEENTQGNNERTQENEQIIDNTVKNPDSTGTFFNNTGTK